VDPPILWGVNSFPIAATDISGIEIESLPTDPVVILYGSRLAISEYGVSVLDTPIPQHINSINSQTVTH
jgi:3D (Asp-Asp-Asp) domain-containing protein